MKQILVVLLLVGGCWAQAINPNQIKPGTFQDGTYNFPGTLAVGTVSQTGAVNATQFTDLAGTVREALTRFEPVVTPTHNNTLADHLRVDGGQLNCGDSTGVGGTNYRECIPFIIAPRIKRPTNPLAPMNAYFASADASPVDVAGGAATTKGSNADSAVRYGESAPSAAVCGNDNAYCDHHNFTWLVGSANFGVDGKMYYRTPAFGPTNINGSLAVSSALGDVRVAASGDFRLDVSATKITARVNELRMVGTTPSIYLQDGPAVKWYGVPGNTYVPVGLRGNGFITDGGGLVSEAVVTSGAVASISIADGGAGFTGTPLCLISGGTGTGALCHFNLLDGITGAVVDNGGNGYTAPVCSVTGGGGSGATCTATVVGGVITAIAVTQGTGYTSIPSMTITDATGTGAWGHFTTKVASATIDAGGSGYGSPTGARWRIQVRTNGLCFDNMTAAGYRQCILADGSIQPTNDNYSSLGDLTHRFKTGYIALLYGNLTGNVTGNADTATSAAALTATPTQCAANNFATGIAASGNANCARPALATLSDASTVVTTAGGATLAAANTVTGLPAGCMNLPCYVLDGELTAQSANVSATELIASAVAGSYELSCSATATTAATTSSTLPACYLSCVQPEDSVARSHYGPASNGATSNNTTGAVTSIIMCPAKAGTSIKWGTTSYASSGATAMVYRVYYTLKRTK